jgi:hypothetical protein
VFLKKRISSVGSNLPWQEFSAVNLSLNADPFPPILDGFFAVENPSNLGNKRSNFQSLSISKGQSITKRIFV